MQLKIPTEITDKLNLISEVVLEMCNNSVVLTPQIIALGSVVIHDDIFDEALYVNFKTTFKDNTIKNFIFHEKHLILHPNAIIKLKKELSSNMTVIFGNVPPHLLRVNFNSPYENTLEGRHVVLQTLKDKVTSIPKSRNFKTGKNLIYYTLFDDGADYITLLARSIKSLGSSDIFDILVFTDEPTKIKIENALEGHDKTIIYKIVDTPADGIEASKTKTQIYTFENINNYENILYLDADTICIGDITSVFSLDIVYGRLYTAFNSNLKVELHKTSLFHGFKVITDEEYALVQSKNQVPFNAGQFLFKNSTKMKAHFDNVNWFMENWPGEYFFEQSFMNHYFCINGLTDPGKFNKLVKLIPSGKMDTPNVNQIILHFIGPALDGKTKLSHMENYLMKNNI